LLYEFEKLALQYNKLEPEFDSNLLKLLVSDDPNVVQHCVDSLYMLLHSEIPANNKNGELWLFELLRDRFEEQNISNSYLLSAIDDLVVSLYRSQNFKTRRIFLSITEKLILLNKSRMKTSPEKAKLADLFAILNKNLTCLVKAAEKSKSNLLYMFHLIFCLVSASTSNVMDMSSDVSLVTANRPDTIFNRFLCGDVLVSTSLLKLVDIALLAHVFTNLGEGDVDLEKQVLLHLLIYRCRNEQSSLEAVGGVSFFQKLLHSPSPQISFFAGQFIVEKLEEEDPMQYIALLSRLLAKAQEEGDENIVSNQYLQIKTILQLSSLV